MLHATGRRASTKTFWERSTQVAVVALVVAGRTPTKQSICHQQLSLWGTRVDMIKPFEILKTTEEDFGIAVEYKVSKRYIENPEYPEDTNATGYWLKGMFKTETIVSYMIVPYGEDIDSYVYNAVKKEGWIQ